VGQPHRQFSPLSRRRFLLAAGAAGATSLISSSLRAAESGPAIPASAPTAPALPAKKKLLEPFEVSASLYAWELHDEGIEKILDNLQEMSACNSVHLIGLMHPEHRPLTGTVFPHNPVRQTWDVEDARVYWHPELKRYGRIKPRLSDFDWLNGTDWLKVMVEAARKRGLKTGVEISHVTLDRERAERDFPDVVERNIHGELTHVRPQFRPICPNNPDALAYDLALWGDLAANYDLDYFQSCTISFDEGGPDKGACFCDSCKKVALENGFDLAKAQIVLLANPRAEPEAGQWQKFREESVVRYYKAVRAAIHASKPKADLRYNVHMTARNPLDWGINLPLMKPQLDSLRIMDYAEQQGNAAALEPKRTWLAEIRAEMGPDFPLLTAIAVRPRATPELIRQGIQLAVDTTMDGITLGHYDGADFPDLRAVREGLVAAKVEVAPWPAKEKAAPVDPAAKPAAPPKV